MNQLQYSVAIRTYILDSPARAYVKQVKGHTAIEGCERCDQEGEKSYRGMTIFQTVKGNPRTDESFSNQTDPGHHLGVSPLADLPDHGLVSMFALDPMHLLEHGVLKRFLLFLLGKYTTRVKLDANAILSVSAILESLHPYIVRELARTKPRALALVGKCKATELRLFLLYIGIVALDCDGVAENVYKLFLILFGASRIVSSPVLVLDEKFVNFAEKLFETFVQHSGDAQVCGKHFVSYNIHSLLHLVDDVRRYGVLTNFSAYPFENFLGVLKRLVRSGVNIPQQLARRLAEREGVYDDDVPVSESEQFSLGPFNEKLGGHSYLACDSFVLIPQSKKDCFFKLANAVGKLKCISQVGSEVVVTADICNELGDFFTYPTSSKKIGVFVLKQWTSFNIKLGVSQIAGKVMVLPLTKGDIGVELLHTTNNWVRVPLVISFYI